MVRDADMMIFGSKLGGGSRGVAPWNLEGVAE
jgi:hypothetical protein